MKTREVIGVALPVLKGVSVCAACGGEFACGASLGGCWCAEVELSEAARAQLRARYEGCLCRTCLERFVEGAGGEEGAAGV